METAFEAISRQFFDIETWLGAAPIGMGNINDTYRADFQSAGIPQSRLLQRLNHTVFTNPQAVMTNIRAVAQHLSGQPDFPLHIPAPVPTRAGSLLYTDDAGNYWRMFPFYRDTFAPEQLPEPEIAVEAAKAYGLFLRALRTFPADQLTETIPGFHDTDRRWAVFEDVLKRDPAQRVAGTKTEIDALFLVKPVFEKISQLKKSGALPLRVTHNDTKAGNVLLDMQTGRAVAVIDWDTIMPGTVLSDFGDMVRTFAPAGGEDTPVAALSIRPDTLEALCRGFLSETSGFLTETERAQLPLGALWIIGEQALRFLSDYLSGDTYYKIRYPEHNLVRARNQLALYQKIKEKFDWLGRLTSAAC